MADLRVIGAGLGRTGTASLKSALEHLLGAPCYHMIEVFENLEHIPMWRSAALGHEPDWHTMFRNYQAAVDWPAASFWPELSRAFPDALVLLSLRDPESWWRSVSSTIFTEHNPVPETDWWQMWQDIVTNRFTNKLDNKAACLEAFHRHYDQVRKTVPAGRLLEWNVKDGWGPICAALELPVPNMPFPHENTTEEFLARNQA